MDRIHRQHSSGFFDSGKLETIYFAALFLLHPLVMHNGYFDITETKQIVFTILSSAFLLMCFVRYLVRSRKMPLFCGAEGVFALLVIFYIASSILSGYVSEAWIAADNRYQGIASFVLYFFVFFMLSRADLSFGAVYAAMTAFALSMVLAVANHWGADPLGVMDKLIAFDRGRYISTIGNINFFGAYVSLLLPVWWFLWCSAFGRRTQWLWLTGIVLGTFGAAASKSEGVVLGLAVAWVLMPILLRRFPEILRRWPLLLAVTSVSLLLFRVITGYVGGDSFSALTRLLMRFPVAFAMTAVGVAFFLWLRKQDDHQLISFQNRYLRWLLLAFFLLLLLLAVMNTLLADKDLGLLSKYLVFDGDWGTDRGVVWQTCAQRWGQLPWWQKLLGAGSGCVARLDAASPVFPDAVLDAAHCEYLHYLMTHGAVGLILYLVLNGCILLRVYRCGTPEELALALGVIGYLAQSSVNIAQPLTTPLYFVVLSSLNGRIQSSRRFERT